MEKAKMNDSQTVKTPAGKENIHGISHQLVKKKPLKIGECLCSLGKNQGFQV